MPGPERLCRKCDTVKSGDDFYDLKHTCKICKLIYAKGYYIENVEKIGEYRQTYYKANREEIIAKQIERDNLPNNAEAKRLYGIEYRNKEENKIKSRARAKIKNAKPENKLRKTISLSVRDALMAKGKSKGGKSFFQAVGYSHHDVKRHLENLFEPWMNWENRGLYDPKTWKDDDSSTWTWRLDHIIPHSEFPYEDMECDDFKKCWNLSNLRPLAAKQNVYDGSYKIRHKKENK